MNIFETQYQELEQLAKYNEYSQLTKRIIDLALDTEDIEQYRNMVDLLDWLDYEPNEEEKKERLNKMLSDLHTILKDKKIQRSEEPLVGTVNLCKEYSKSRFQLGPISFMLKEGEIIGLVGENGNGKTTLLRSLCGELKSTSGSIAYNFPYQDLYDLRSHLIYIPQRTDTWRGSLLSNLQFAATCYGIKGEENELIVQLIIARMGLRKYREYKWKDLSSGYKMRFELARALLRKPKILLIDEPLANLDILAQQVVLDDFKDIARSPFRPVGIILSSQQLYEVEKASDNVIFLKEGVPQNLKKANGEGAAEIVKFIIEFETDWKQEPLREALQELAIEQLQINGGTYVGTFPDNVTQQDFVQFALNKGITLHYYRNISQSTRRFFLS